MNPARKTTLPGEPVYVQIEGELRSEITQGQINPGEMLPSESALMTRFDASRETVRRSLKELEYKGIIYPRPGKGYFVAEPEHNLYSLIFDDSDKDFDSEFHSINTVAPQEDVREALDLFNEKHVIKISRVILRRGDPVAYDEKYLPYDKGEPLVEAEIKYAVFQDLAAIKSPPFAFYTRLEIGSVNADEDISRILKCKKNESLLVLYRYSIRHDGKKLGYGKKFLTAKWGRLEALSGYRDSV
jgi:GntR family transcriptional regulator